MTNPLFVAIAGFLILSTASCSFPGADPTPALPTPPETASPSGPTLTPALPEPTVTIPPVEDTPVAYTPCQGPVTGVMITLPNPAWTCSTELLGDAGSGNENIHLASPLFTILMSTLGRGPFCNFPGQDESCVEIPFYENKVVSLSTWSSYGEIKEIFGVIRTTINGQAAGLTVSVKYIGMEQRELTQAEKQELVDLLDSISLKH